MLNNLWGNDLQMKRYAVFVGVNDYSNDITPLRCACKDAKTLSLKFAKAGFELPELLLDNDAASGKILNVLDEIGKKIQPGDLLVFYFAGHGRELNNEHFLVCKDGYADPKRYTIGSLPLSAVVDSTGKEGVHRLFILDCCRDNLLAGRSTAYACETARSIALDSALKVKSGLIPPLILSSCSSGEKAFEDQKSGHGYFTKALLKTIEDSGVQNFRTFSEVLNDNMTAPGAQHIAWNGNINDWNDVRLFGSWNTAPQPAPQPQPAPKPEDYYEVQIKFNDCQKALELNKISLNKELEKQLKLAEAAKKDSDFTAEKKISGKIHRYCQQSYQQKTHCGRIKNCQSTGYSIQ